MLSDEEEHGEGETVNCSLSGGRQPASAFDSGPPRVSLSPAHMDSPLRVSLEGDLCLAACAHQCQRLMRQPRSFLILLVPSFSPGWGSQSAAQQHKITPWRPTTAVGKLAMMLRHCPPSCPDSKASTSQQNSTKRRTQSRHRPESKHQSWSPQCSR